MKPTTPEPEARYKFISTRSDIEKWKAFPRRKEFIFLIIANLIDLCITTYAIVSGIAEEINPIMSHLIDDGIVYFTIVKLSGMQIGLSIVYRHWLKTGRVLLNRSWFAIVAIYGFILVWNTVMIILGHVFTDYT